MIKDITARRVPTSFEHLLFRNIIVGGGNTKISGFKQRLTNEMLSGGNQTDIS